MEVIPGYQTPINLPSFPPTMAAMEEATGRDGRATEIHPLNVGSLHKDSPPEELSEQEIKAFCVQLLRYRGCLFLQHGLTHSYY